MRKSQWKTSKRKNSIKKAMLTSSSGGTGTAAASSRIPVAKHRQTSPEHYPNHNHFQQIPSQQQHHVSRLPKYQLSSGSQHDSAVSSGGNSSGGGSGESEGEASVNNSKRRKDSAGSITGLHGAPGNLNLFAVSYAECKFILSQFT